MVRALGEPWEPGQSRVGQTRSHRPALLLQPLLAQSHLSCALHMICMLLTSWQAAGWSMDPRHCIENQNHP